MIPVHITFVLLFGCAKQSPVIEIPQQEPEATKPKEMHPTAVSGFMDKSLIDSTIKQHLDEIQACYTQNRKENALSSGRVSINFEIDGNGTTTNLSTTENTLHSPQFTNCLLDVFSRIKFPRGLQNDITHDANSIEKQNISVSYPLLFEVK